MGEVIYDPVLKRKRIELISEEVRDVLIDLATSDASLKDIFTENFIAGDHTVESDTDNHLCFRNGDTNVTCTFTTPVIGIRYRVAKHDDGAGSVTVYDHEGTLIATLYEEGEWFDIKYYSTGNYLIR